jgi:hypothetical protein
MRVTGVAVIMLLAGCGGGGGTTGTNYSDPPPMAELVANSSASPSATPSPSPTPSASPEKMTMVDPDTGLPADVAAFQTRRALCDRWRGEDSTDAERKREIADSVTEHCKGTDAELARLKEAHAGEIDVQRILAAYETEVE